MLEYDVLIIGGGPIGGHVARKIAEKEYKVGVLEKNKAIAQHLNCAGLVTSRVLESADVTKKDIIQNKIKGANIHSPSNKIITIGGDKIHAIAIDRTKFDREIIKNAENKGAKIFLGNNVRNFHKKNNTYFLKTSKNLEIKCNILIGADGPYSKTRKLLTSYQPKEYLRGIGAEITDTSLNPDFVEIFVGRNIAPGFFAWLIPINKDGSKARIGLCTSKEATNPPKYYFSKMFKNKNFEPFLKNYKITRHIGGAIPIGPLKKTYDDNLMLVGDAAAQVKPTSGGGLFPGISCADYCSKVAIDSLQKRDFSSNFLKSYQKLWQKNIGSELRKGMRFRSIFKNISDKKMDKYFEKLQNPEIIETINEYGDIDYPSKLVKPLLKKTRFFI
jgi:geranylgeranyl reductase family protein